MLNESHYHGTFRVNVKKEEGSSLLHVDVYHVPGPAGSATGFVASLEVDCVKNRVDAYDAGADESHPLYSREPDPPRWSVAWRERMAEILCDCGSEKPALTCDCQPAPGPMGYWKASVRVPMGYWKATEMPLPLIWTTHDSRRAQEEGWDVFEAGASVMIQMDDADDRFECDDDAVDHVREQAGAGRRFHQRAMAIHRAGEWAHVAIHEKFGGAYFLAPRERWHQENLGQPGHAKTVCRRCDGDYVLMWLPDSGEWEGLTTLTWESPDDIVEVELDRIDAYVAKEASEARAILVEELTHGGSTWPPEPDCTCGGVK